MVRMRHPSECAGLYYARLLRPAMSVNIELRSAWRADRNGPAAGQIMPGPDPRKGVYASGRPETQISDDR